MKKSRFSSMIKCTLCILLAVSAANAISFSEYRDRDAGRFVLKDPKPFRPDKDVVTVVMREAIPRGGGYTYQYPRENPEPVLTDKYAMEGALSMEIELIASDYSGVAICIAGSVDLTPYLEEGVLEFWIKGEKGGENALFVLVDDGVHHVKEEGLVHAQQLTVAGGPAKQAAQDVAAPLVGGQHAVCNHKDGGANVIGDDAQ